VIDDVVGHGADHAQLFSPGRQFRQVFADLQSGYCSADRLRCFYRRSLSEESRQFVEFGGVPRFWGSCCPANESQRVSGQEFSFQFSVGGWWLVVGGWWLVVGGDGSRGTRCAAKGLVVGAVMAPWSSREKCD
jgi:hypothetical protein